MKRDERNERDAHTALTDTAKLRTLDVIHGEIRRIKPTLATCPYCWTIYPATGACPNFGCPL